MLKKISTRILLIGFIGILVWGGVNRTLAKSNNSDGRNANNKSVGRDEISVGNGVQQGRNKDNEGHADVECDDESPSWGAKGQTQSLSQIENDYDVEKKSEIQGWGKRNLNGRGNLIGSGNRKGSGSEPLTDSEIEALILAIDDEFHALAVYQSVIITFGQVEPFIDIVLSEQRHIDALSNQFAKHNLQVPDNPWIGNIPSFDNLQQACQVGVEAEIANVDLYKQLFSMTDDPSLTRVFTNLSQAALNSHLPQFEACQ